MIFKRVLLIILFFNTSIVYANVIVPNVVGLTIDQATKKLKDNQLNIGQIDQQKAHHSDGTILVQAPRAQQSVPEGYSVRLIVAIPEKKPATTVVPALGGLTFKEAKKRIQQANLALGTINRLKKSTKKGLVLSQNPPANKQLIINSKVNLILSSSSSQSNTTEIKLSFNKKHINIGEKVTFKAQILNAPNGEVPLFNFIINRKAHETSYSRFIHPFSKPGKYNVAVAVLYGNKPWVTSATQTIIVGSNDKTPQNQEKYNINKAKEEQQQIAADTKPIHDNKANNHQTPNTQKNIRKVSKINPKNIKLTVSRKSFNVGESTQLSIQLKHKDTKNLFYAFTVNGTVHKTKKPNYTLLFPKAGKYIVTGSVRQGQGAWVASKPIKLISEFNHSGNNNPQQEKISGTRIRAVLDKFTYQVGETIELKLDACNVPSNVIPRYSFTIDQKVYQISSPYFSHTFKSAGTHVITASIRYGRSPWIQSLSKMVNIIPTDSKYINRDIKLPNQQPESYLTTPKVTGLSINKALKKLSKWGLKGAIIDSDKQGKVQSQNPPAYSCTAIGSKVQISTRKNKAENLLATNTTKSFKINIDSSVSLSNKSTLAEKINIDDDKIAEKLNNTKESSKDIKAKKTKQISSQRNNPKVSKRKTTEKNTQTKKKPKSEVKMKRKSHLTKKKDDIRNETKEAKIKPSKKLNEDNRNIQTKLQATPTTIKKVKSKTVSDQLQDQFETKAPVTSSEKSTKVYRSKNMTAEENSIQSNKQKGKQQKKLNKAASIEEKLEPKQPVNSNSRATVPVSEISSARKEKGLLKQKIINNNIKTATLPTATNKPALNKMANKSSNSQLNIADGVTEEEYLLALSSESSDSEYQSINTEESISELAAIFHSLASSQLLESQPFEATNDIDLKEVSSKEAQKNTSTPTQARPIQSRMDKLYLIASTQHILEGDKVEFTLTRTISKFDSEYYIVFHDEGEIIPTKQGQLEHTFNKWGIYNVYAEANKANTEQSVSKSKMVQIWVWPSWFSVLFWILGTISLILLTFYIYKKARKLMP